MATLLDDKQIEAELAEVTGWSRHGDKLTRSLTFSNFSEAFGFMTRVALAAEKLNHHPDWSNSWNKVDITITDHEAGGISDLCLRLAKAVNEAAGS